MKNVKKVFALMLAFAMVLAMSATVFAAADNSIDVTNTVEDETYSIYKMMDLSVNSELTAYRYTVTDEWQEFFTGSGAGAEYVEIDSQGYVTWKTDKMSDDALEAFSKAAAIYAKGTTAVADIAGNGATITFGNLENGYYLITSTLGTRAMVETTPDKQQATINEKNPKDDITKQVQEDKTGNWGTTNDAQVGDTINFKSVIELLKNTRNVTVVDTMDSGLTYTARSVAIADLTEGTDYTVSSESATGFTVTFTEAYLNGLTKVKTELEMTYSAVLNENAISSDSGVSIVDQKNRIVLNYGDEQSVEQETTTTTHKFSVFKHAHTSPEDNLAGAVFEVKKAGTVVPLIKIDDTNFRVANQGESGSVTTFTTVDSGDIVIWGVDSDADYTLNETEPPEGYNKLPAEVQVNVSATTDTRVDVENNTGNELPSTGGIGTVIFYVVGAALLIGCGVVLISRRRVSGK